MLVSWHLWKHNSTLDATACSPIDRCGIDELGGLFDNLLGLMREVANMFMAANALAKKL